LINRFSVLVDKSPNVQDFLHAAGNLGHLDLRFHRPPHSNSPTDAESKSTTETLERVFSSPALTSSESKPSNPRWWPFSWRKTTQRPTMKQLVSVLAFAFLMRLSQWQQELANSNSFFNPFTGKRAAPLFVLSDPGGNLPTSVREHMLYPPVEAAVCVCSLTDVFISHQSSQRVHFEYTLDGKQDEDNCMTRGLRSWKSMLSQFFSVMPSDKQNPTLKVALVLNKLLLFFIDILF
jgi:hypothetical protein